jgi:hypothetical protein
MPLTNHNPVKQQSVAKATAVSRDAGPARLPDGSLITRSVWTAAVDRRSHPPTAQPMPEQFFCLSTTWSRIIHKLCLNKRKFPANV